MALIKRKLDVTLKLNPMEDRATGRTNAPKFARSGTDSLTLSGYRCSAVIQNFGSISQSQMILKVFGMPLDLMNEVSTLGRLPLAGRNNTVTLLAGDEKAGMSVAYTGTVSAAWADFQSMPEVAFIIQAQAGLYAAVGPTEPTSFSGSADAAFILSGIAARMGRAFQNNGVSVQLSNPAYRGTLLDQLHACVRDAGIEFDDSGTKIVIWPRGKDRGSPVIEISPTAGLVGYPAYTQSGVSLLTLYNPAIERGGLVKVTSSLTPACGTWAIFSLAHALDSETVGGQWFTYIEASDPAYAPLR